MEHQEIEARFLEIDVEALKKRLIELNAKDLGEDLLDEVIIYDQDRSWLSTGKLLRLRTRNGQTVLTYKHNLESTATGTEEIEFEVSDGAKAEVFLERLGYSSFRQQQKRRHTYELGDVTVDIDTWPRVPTYVELEGPSEASIQDAAKRLGFDWNDAVFENPRAVIEKKYGIPLREMHWFTFDRFE